MAEPLWTSEEIAAATGGKPAGGGFTAAGVSIDTRTIEPGDLFVAMGGVRDGHEFVGQAMAAGAAGVLASQAIDAPAVIVADTLVALEKLGAAARDRTKEIGKEKDGHKGAHEEIRQKETGEDEDCEEGC